MLYFFERGQSIANYVAVFEITTKGLDPNMFELKCQQVLKIDIHSKEMDSLSLLSPQLISKNLLAFETFSTQKSTPNGVAIFNIEEQLGEIEKISFSTKIEQKKVKDQKLWVQSINEKQIAIISEQKIEIHKF